MAKEIVNSVFLRNPKKTPDNIAKFAYKTIKNDRKKGLEKLLESQLLIALKNKNKKGQDISLALNSGLLICYSRLHVNLTRNKKLYLDLPFKNLDELMKNVKN